jgi:hypothetical protein
MGHLVASKASSSSRVQSISFGVMFLSMLGFSRDSNARKASIDNVCRDGVCRVGPKRQTHQPYVLCVCLKVSWARLFQSCP